MSHVCVLYGSPRKDGNSESLTEALLRGMAVEGAIDRFHLADMNIGPCTDCRKCWGQGRPCIFEDDLDEIYASLEKADTVVFATPLYWYSWSAQLKPVLDRFVPFVDDRAAWNVKGKRAILVSAAGDGDPSCFDGLVASFRKSINLLGMKNGGEVCKPGLFARDAVSQNAKLQEEVEAEGSNLG
ncbi:MAG: flavodoxin family protein [Synergistales bacterium]|nr:flavodoxin family protein [Synergistales bacterium]